MKISLFTTLFIIISSFILPITAQEISSDSLDYENQRQKVNRLLDERNIKYGQYDESLKKRTGIFGLKTKRDMQESIDILLKIVETDQHIFRETKNLLNYKDQILSYETFEKNKIKELADDYDKRIDNYIQTISKLQKEQESLKEEIEALKTQSGIFTGLSFLLIALGFGLVIYKYFYKQKITKS